MSFLKLWLAATGAMLAAGMMWAFAPILIPVLIMAAVLGVVVLGVIAVARWIEARRQPLDHEASPPGPDMQPGQ